MQAAAENMSNILRRKVSGQKTRFTDEEYDLDLCYITPQLIAMGFPASGLEATYRNSIQTVAAMLNKYHSSHYMLYNLSGRPYDYSVFNDNVFAFGFPDHHNPPLNLLFTIIHSISRWLNADCNNVAVVHCVGGKGRTGTVCAAYLLYAGFCPTPHDALEFFKEKRKVAVTRSAQRRYVKYFHEIQTNKVAPVPRVLLLKRVILCPVPFFAKIGTEKGCYPWLEIYSTSKDKMLLYDSCADSTIPVKGWIASDGAVMFDMSVVLTGDVLLRCKHMKGASKATETMFRYSFHTSFVDVTTTSIMCDMYELDDVDATKFPEDFFMTLIFQEAEQVRAVGNEDDDLAGAISQLWKMDAEGREAKAETVPQLPDSVTLRPHNRMTSRPARPPPTARFSKPDYWRSSPALVGGVDGRLRSHTALEGRQPLSAPFSYTSSPLTVRRPPAVQFSSMDNVLSNKGPPPTPPTAGPSGSGVNTPDSFACTLISGLKQPLRPTHVRARSMGQTDTNGG